MNNVLIWLDDIRDPFDNIKYYKDIPDISIIKWIKTYNEFINYINNNGIPYAICFDHDLGDFNNNDYDKTGYDCAKYLVDYCLNNCLYIPKYYNIQSSNPVGKQNIINILENYHKFYIKNNRK